VPSRQEGWARPAAKRLAIPAVALLILLYFLGPAGMIGASGAVLGGVVDAGQWSVSSARGLLKSEPPSSPPLTLAAIPAAKGIVTSDSRNGGNSTLVLDGDPRTTWVATSSSSSRTTYLQLDLGKQKSIEFIQWVIPQDGVGATLNLYVSNDGKNWTFNRSVVLNRDDVSVVRNRRLDANARFVRLEFSNWKSSRIEAEVAEVRVILTGETGANVPPPAKPAVATSTNVPVTELSNPLPTAVKRSDAHETVTPPTPTSSPTASSPPEPTTRSGEQAVPTIAPRR